MDWLFFPHGEFILIVTCYTVIPNKLVVYYINTCKIKQQFDINIINHL